MTRRFNLCLITVVLLGAVFGGVVGDQVLATDGTEPDGLARVARLVALVEENYPEDVDSDKVVFGGIRAMLRTLDPHSSFLEPKTYSTMREEQRGHFSGLGIVVTKKDSALTVISPIEDTPAYRLGIRAGDIIAKIEGEATDEMTLDTAVSRLKGPKGTQVSITISRAGTEPFELTITRDDIATKSVSRAFMVDPEVGYIRIKNFTQTTHGEIVEALEQLESEGMKGLILDLRSNPGGLLDQAVKVADLFIEKSQTIVYTKGRLPESNQSFSAKHHEHGDRPMVILVNHGSASASEIVAGAVQDHDVGLVVGEATWGKGLVQSVYSLKYDAGLALTTAKYYTPSGRSIQRDYSSFEDYYEYDPAEPRMPNPDEERRTDAGRVVYGGGGIAPDIYIDAPKLSEAQQELERRDVFFRFGVAYAGKHPVKLDFEATDAVLAEFATFVAENHKEITPETLVAERAYIRRSLEERILAAAFGLEAGAQRAARYDVYVEKARQLMPEAKALREKRRLHLANVGRLPTDKDLRMSGARTTDAPKAAGQ